MPRILATYDGDAIVSAAGNLLFLGRGTDGLEIVDVSDPANPVQLCVYDTRAKAANVVVSGSIAYVNDTSELLALDISDPANPIEIGAVDTMDTCYDIFVDGTYVYAGIASDYIGPAFWGLRVFDVADPAAPTLVAEYGLAHAPRDVQVFGNLAYLANENTGLIILDVSDPTTPTLAGVVNTVGFCVDVEVSAFTAYLADRHGGLYVVDVSDPTAPVVRHVLTDDSDWCWGLALSGGRLYTAMGQSGLEIRQDLSPQVTGVVAVDAATVRVDLAAPLAGGDYVFAVRPGARDTQGNTMDLDADGLGGEIADDLYTFSTTVDAVPPAMPTGLAMADDTGPAGDAVTTDTSLTFSWLPVLTADLAGYEIRWDGGDWSATTDTSVTLAAAEGERLFEVRSVDLAGNVSTATSLAVTVDVTPPAGARGPPDGGVGRRSGTSPPTPAGSGSTSSASTAAPGSRTADAQADTSLSNGQMAFIEVRAVDRAGNVGAIAAATLAANDGPRVIGHSPDGLVASADGFRVTFNEPVDPATVNDETVRVFGPAATLLGEVDTEAARSVALSGDLAVVAEWNQGVRIVDISEPSAPVLRGSCATSGYAAYSVVRLGHAGLCADGHRGRGLHRHHRPPIHPACWERTSPTAGSATPGWTGRWPTSPTTPAA